MRKRVHALRDLGGVDQSLRCQETLTARIAGVGPRAGNESHPETARDPVDRQRLAFAWLVENFHGVLHSA